MKRLDWYIGSTVLSATLLAWLVVVSLESVFSLLGEIGDIGRGTYGLGDAALVTLLSLPGHAYQSFPMAALIGALLGLGGLAAQAELNAFRLAGCSPSRLLRAVLQIGLLMVVGAAAVGEGWAPATEQLASRLRTSAIFDEVSVEPDFAFWVRDGRRLIRVGQSGAAGSLNDIQVYEIDATPRLKSASVVSQARYLQGQWQVQGIQASHFSDQAVDVRGSERAQWPTLMNPRLAQLLTRHPQALSLPELAEYIHLQRDGSNIDRYRLVFWQNRSVGQRVLVGVLVGLAFKLLNETAAHAGLVYGVPPWLSALTPTLLVATAGLLLLPHRTRRLAGG
jgi:lipopolysaccharide export system permease protein